MRPLIAIVVPTEAVKAARAAFDRKWGRYQRRLAVGHASLSHPHDALRYALRATKHLHRSGTESLELVSALDMVATCQRELGQLAAAAQTRRQSIDILDAVAPGGIEWITALTKLGDLCRFQGEFHDAEEVICRALAGARNEHHIDGMPARAAILTALGVVYKDTGRYDAATHAYTEALDLVTARYEPDHPCTAALWHNLAGLAHAQGHPDQAATLAARAVCIRECHLGPDHHLVAQDLAVLGVALLDQDRVDDAEPLFERALTIFRRRNPADQYEIAVNLSNIAACRFAGGDALKAEHLLREGLTIKRAILGPEHPEIARQLNNLAVVVAKHRPSAANDLHRQAISILEHALSASHPLTVACRANADFWRLPNDRPGVPGLGSRPRAFGWGRMRARRPQPDPR